MCTKVSTLYTGIDVSTGEVVNKFYEGASPELRVQRLSHMHILAIVVYVCKDRLRIRLREGGCF